MFLFPEPRRQSTDRKIKDKLSGIDYIGSILLISSLTCLLLGLQWGGIVWPWSNSKVWGCLLGFVLILAAFVVVQKYRKEEYVIHFSIGL